MNDIPVRNVDIGIFAYNEEGKIDRLLGDLARQTLFADHHTKLKIRILCNGCTDRTAEVASAAVQNSDILRPITLINNFELGGKSRTWNRFVGELPEDSEFCLFIDADVEIRAPATLENMLVELQQCQAVAVTSRPIKEVNSLRWNPLLRFAARSIAAEHRDGPICGQLYAVRSEAVRDIRLPVPCLVEDGFLSACLITGLFSHPGKYEKVKASVLAIHHFEAPGTLSQFFQHDVRIRLGCELNAALYSELWAAETIEDRTALLREYAASQGLDRAIDEHARHPERSALKRRGICENALIPDRERPISSLARLLPRLAHSIYLDIVRCRAKWLFRKRRFSW